MKNKFHDVDEQKLFIRRRVAALCEKLEISDRQMSFAIGKGENYIRNVKAGEIMPHILVLYKICEYAGITMKDFFDPNFEAPTLVSKLTETARKLNEYDLQAILSVANAFEVKNNE